MRNRQTTHWRHRYAMVIIVVSVGLLLSFSAFLIVRRLEIQRLRTELQFHAQGHVNAVEKEIDRDFSAIRSLRAFFKNSNVVSRDDFRTLTYDILPYNPAFQALEWIPRVLRAQRNEYERDARLDGFKDFRITERGDRGEMIRAGEKDEYFPAYFVEPYKGNETALGYDLASNPTRKAVLEKACDTGQMTATARIPLVRETGKQYGFVVFLPVYRKNTWTDTIELRRKNLIGFLAGVYRAGAIMRDAFPTPDRMTVHLYDISSPRGENLLYAYPTQTGSSPDQTAPQNGFEISHQLTVADRKWQLVCDFAPDFAGHLPMATAWGVLAAGLLLTCLLGVYLTTNIKRTGQIEQMADRLSKEIDERRKNEAQLANACEMARLGPWEYDGEKDLFTFTDSFYAIFGTTAEQVGGYTMSSADYAKRFVHPEDISVVASEIRKGMEIDEPHFSRQLEHRFLYADGTTGYINVRFFVTKDSNGKTIKTTGVNQDVTDRKLAEESLRESEKRYRELFENSTDFVYTLDLRGNFTDVNKAAEDLTGYTKGELIGMNYIDYTPESTHKAISEAFSRAFSEGTPVKDFPLEVIVKDGSRRYFETCVSPVEKGERIIGFQGSSRDVTERRRTEEALHREKERFRFLVEESPLGVALITNEGTYKYINPKFSEIFGYTLEDIPARREWFRKVYPDETYRKRVISRLTKNRKKHGPGELRPETFEMTCKDGSKKTIRYRPVTMKSGDELHLYEDISETHRLEGQLRQAQKMEAIGTLAGGIAHDFNNILTSIIGYTELASSDLDNKQELLEDLQEVRKAGNRARDLVSQILAFSRQHEQEKNPIKVKLIAKEALKLIRASLPTTIDIRNNILSDALVMADATQIHQVLMNLFANAGHAMQSEGGVLEVGLTDVSLDAGFTAGHPDITPGPFLKLTVRDTGSGIAPDIVDRIFEPFFTTKEKGEGTGLGLSVVHGIIKSLGGAVTVYSELEKGTEFNVYLPVIERRVKEEEGSEPPLPTGTERILFIDDEQPIRSMSKKLIESLGYRVEVRSNGTEALELFKDDPERFDLVITDMTMPGMTGDKLAEQLMSVRADIPIILCTGFSAGIDEKKSHAMGIRAFALKPMIKSDIAGIIRKVLDEGKG